MGRSARSTSCGERCNWRALGAVRFGQLTRRRDDTVCRLTDALRMEANEMSGRHPRRALQAAHRLAVCDAITPKPGEHTMVIWNPVLSHRVRACHIYRRRALMCDLLAFERNAAGAEVRELHHQSLVAEGRDRTAVWPIFPAGRQPRCAACAAVWLQATADFGARSPTWAGRETAAVAGGASQASPIA